MQLNVSHISGRPVQSMTVFHVDQTGKKTRMCGDDFHSPGMVMLDLPANANLFDPVFDETGRTVAVSTRHQTTDGAVILVEVTR